MDNLILGKAHLSENTQVIGFFGQSGAGKTSIIKSLPAKIGNYFVVQNTGIIRNLFQTNGKNYTNPAKLLIENEDIFTLKSKSEVITRANIIIEKFIRSQLQLLNDFSTEVFQSVLEKRTSPTNLMFDRSPIDFYTLTVGGIAFLKNELKLKELSDVSNKYLQLVKKTAEKNTEYLFNTVISTPPWQTTNINTLVDGVRDQYLTEYYTGKNWYNTLNEFNLKTTKIVNIDPTLLNINERVNVVAGILEK